jgi:hypothetical protein
MKVVKLLQVLIQRNANFGTGSKLANDIFGISPYCLLVTDISRPRQCGTCKNRAAQCRPWQEPVGTMSVPRCAGRYMSAPWAGTDEGVQPAQGLPYGLTSGPTGSVS